MLRKILLSLLVLSFFVTGAESRAEKYVVATDCTFPPMEYLDDQKQPVGFDPAIIKEIAKASGFEVDVQNIAWDGIFAGVAAGKYEIIGKKKEELVPMLKSLRATGGTAYNDMIAVLDATVEAVNKSGVFSEVGKSGHGSAHVSDAEGKIEGIAKSYMQKEPSMSYTDALAKAWEDNPDLMDAYDAEEGF